MPYPKSPKLSPLAAAIIIFCIFVAACKQQVPLEERLRQQENFLMFDYDDFGPVIYTRYGLGKPEPAGDVPSKKTASGWDVGNVRVVVTLLGSKEQQWAMLEDSGWFDPGIDYRIVWYFNIVSLLDDMIANPKISEPAKASTRATRQKIIDAMGDEEEARARMIPLSDELEAWAKENMVRGRRTEISQQLRAKGLSL